MAILLLGVIILLIGIWMMRNTEMDALLKAKDKDAWVTVMRPSPSGYVNSFGIIPLFSWILSHGYENSSSEEVKVLGGKALRRANTARYLMLSGILFMVIGFFVTLLYPAQMANV